MHKTSALVLGTLLALGCGDDGDGEVPEILPPDATFEASGTVYDLETGEPIDGAATIVVSGIEVNTAVYMSGADFTVTVPANSTFHLIAGSPPDYRSTYNVAVEVGAEDVSGLEVYTASEAYLTQLTLDFGVTPTVGTGIVIIRAADADGTPFAGLPAEDFVLPDGSVGPYFLDADLAADPLATETSASGFALFFDVYPGVMSITTAVDAPNGFVSPTLPVDAGLVSYVQATVNAEGELVLPQDVSFENDVSPIFLSAPVGRGCVSCHDGNGIGKDLGGLHLNGSPNKMHRELTEEDSPIDGIPRVNLESPEASLMLTMPSIEDPPDRHPFATFTGLNDPDYLTILVWIREGALQN